MAASPHVLIQDGAGLFVNPDSTGDPDFPSGVNVTPGNTVSIKLTSADSVGQWTLRVAGTDEETLVPALTDVDPSTGVVNTPNTTVTFTVPAGDAGRAYIFQSMVNNGGPAYTTTFGIYTLVNGVFRVGAVGERFENDPIFGWTRTVNKFIKNGGGSDGGGPGPRGFQGFQGRQGALGAQGWQGNQGRLGNQGNQGIVGIGAQGNQGVIGTGAQGNQGNQGTAGGGGGSALEVRKNGTSIGSDIGILNIIADPATTVTYTPPGVESVGMIGITINPSGSWSLGGNLGSDEVQPSELYPGTGIEFDYALNPALGIKLQDSNTVLSIRIPLTFDATHTITLSSTKFIPTGAVIHDCLVNITTPFTNGTTLKVGRAASLSLLQATTDNDPTVAGIYDAPQDTDWGGGSESLVVTIHNGDTIVAGAGFVTVLYSVPNT